MSDLIPTKTAQDVAREMISQPALFSDLDGLEGFSPTHQAVQRYTGERSTTDDQRNLFVGALRLLGASDRQIEEACQAKGFGLTRRTIPLILADLEKSGRITPLKERLALACGDNAEQANIALRELLGRVGQSRTKTIRVKGEAVEVEDDGISVELAAMIKAVSTAVGITTEKVLLLTGQATEIVDVRVQAGREAFESWWQAEVIPIQATIQPADGAVDSASAAPATIPEHPLTLADVGHEPDTSPTTDQAATPTEPPTPEPRDDGGGGGPFAAGGGPTTTG